MNAYLRAYNELYDGKSRMQMYNDTRAYSRRHELVVEYAWAVPTDEALAAIAGLGKVVEIGAGTGYWAALLQDLGCRCRCFDVAPPGGAVRNAYRHARQWTVVEPGGPEVLKDFGDHALLLCWPPYESRMAADCLLNYRGDTLVYIGERSDGCTADPVFFWLRDGACSAYAAETVVPGFSRGEDDSWDLQESRAREAMLAAFGEPQGWELQRVVDIPQWTGIHDRMEIWKR